MRYGSTIRKEVPKKSAVRALWCRQGARLVVVQQLEGVRREFLCRCHFEVYLDVKVTLDFSRGV